MTEAANRIQELEAALDTTAAKLLRDALDALQHCNEEKVQLGRQIAAWKVEYERVDGTNQALASECTDLRRQVAELSKP